MADLLLREPYKRNWPAVAAHDGPHVGEGQGRLNLSMASIASKYPKAFGSPKNARWRLQLPDNSLVAEALYMRRVYTPRKTIPTIPERVETPNLPMTILMKALTVLGLIFIRPAISLLVSP
jgi:hypothetical protein